eukprot:CFRG4869T1
MTESESADMTGKLGQPSMSFSQIFNSFAENGSTVVGEHGNEVGQEVMFSVMRRSTSNAQATMATRDYNTNAQQTFQPDGQATNAGYYASEPLEDNGLYSGRIEIEDGGYQYIMNPMNNPLGILPATLPSYLDNVSASYDAHGSLANLIGLPFVNDGRAADSNAQGIQSHPELVPPAAQSPPLPLDSSHTPVPGIYGFGVNVGHLDTSNPTGKLNGSTTYSKLLDRLFININVYTPITIATNKQPPPGAMVRCFVVFSSQEKCRDIVTRCPNHRSPTDPTNQSVDANEVPLSHMLHVSHPKALYCPSNTGIESVLIPYRPTEISFAKASKIKRPSGTTDSTTDAPTLQEHTYVRFMCFSSCPGSINRENIHAVFRLELGDEILGVASLDTKICSCPSRDKAKAEKLARAHVGMSDRNSNAKSMKHEVRGSDGAGTVKRRSPITHSVSSASTPSNQKGFVGPASVLTRSASQRLQENNMQTRTKGQADSSMYKSNIHSHPNGININGSTKLMARGREDSNRLGSGVDNGLEHTNGGGSTRTYYNVSAMLNSNTREPGGHNKFDDELYYVTVRGRKNYEILSRVAEGLTCTSQKPQRALSYRRHPGAPAKVQSIVVSNHSSKEPVKPISSERARATAIPRVVTSSITSPHIPTSQGDITTPKRSKRLLVSSEAKIQSPARRAIGKGVDITVNGSEVRQNNPKKSRVNGQNKPATRQGNKTHRAVQNNADGSSTEEEPELADRSIIPPLTSKSRISVPTRSHQTRRSSARLN